MSDYDDPINIYDYKYKKPVYFTNPFLTYQTNMIVKLVLTSDNFNFDLANFDGSDFRLLEYRTGVGVLKTWVAYWSQSQKHAVLFFKLPTIGGGASITLSAYWGNSMAQDISDPSSMGFLFYEDFSGSTISTSKWSGDTSAGSSTYGYLFPSNSSFVTTTNPLLEKTSWVVEAGVYADFSSSGWDYNDAAIRFGFEGTENNFIVNIMHVDHIETNIREPGGGTYSNSTKTHGGLEPYSYQEVYIDYYEPADNVKVKLRNRNTYSDVEHDIERRVEGDTRPINVRIYGRQTSDYADGAYPTYISWFIVRDYDGISSYGGLDGRDLYIPYENVPAATRDFREYLPDLTDTIYQHESSFGGDPYALSDNMYDSNDNVWVSDEDATLEDYVALTIHTGWSEDVSARKYIHYDSGHVYYYNASKLSDDEADRMGRDFWHSTTTSGWAAIKFDSSTSIGAFRIKATSDMDACPKNFVFYGSNYNPVRDFDKAVLLITDIFAQTEEWQSRVFISRARYKYYILDVLDTYGDANIKIQEWEMMPYLGQRERRYVTQLRLHPALYSSWEYNFPKEISLQASNDGIVWATLIPWTNTYTPFTMVYLEYGYWQRYSFVNDNGYWSFRLLCRGNWGADDNRIIIGEWSLHERAEEAFTYRILGGTTNNIQQIWATPTCGIDDEYALIFIANERMNRVSAHILGGVDELPNSYDDFNVV
jgi:hypothetical protein